MNDHGAIQSGPGPDLRLDIDINKRIKKVLTGLECHLSGCQTNLTMVRIMRVAVWGALHAGRIVRNMQMGMSALVPRYNQTQIYGQIQGT